MALYAIGMWVFLCVSVCVFMDMHQFVLYAAVAYVYARVCTAVRVYSW